MNTQTLILAILNLEDASGYEMKKQSTEGAFSYFVDISYGSIYPTLARLEKEGLVTCRSQAQSGKPDKKVYSITDAGRLEFLKTLTALPQPDKFKSEFLLMAMYADLTAPQIIEQAIDAYIMEISKIVGHIEQLGSDCDHAATQWVADYGMHVTQAKLDYLKQNRDQLIGLAGSQLTYSEKAE